MRMIQRIAPALLLAVVTTACATAVRAPVADVPAGTYVLVEPETGVYQAVSINERAHALRVGDDVITGQHWVDADGRLHIVPDEGPCVGQESIWTYSYTGNRITMNLVQDRCTARVDPLPQRLVYQRR